MGISFVFTVFSGHQLRLYDDLVNIQIANGVEGICWHSVHLTLLVLIGCIILKIWSIYEVG